MRTETLNQQLYIVEGEEVSLEEIKTENEFDDNDELFIKISSMQIGETIGENLNMATITRIK